MTLPAYIIKIRNIPKFSTGKNWPAHRIQHISISRIHCSDVGFGLFKGGFWPVENPKVGLQREILEQIWADQNEKFFLHMKVQPRFLGSPQDFGPMTSSWWVMTSSKILWFPINFRNSENLNPYANNEYDKI